MSKTANRTGFVHSRCGAAMTETALLCFFIYVPVLMMVIVWGDMTLDKERAHIAASYMAFRSESVDESSLRSKFFPFADGSADPTGSVRRVMMNPGEDDRAAEGPEFTLPSTSAGDYSDDPPDFDLQYKLFSIAVPNTHVTKKLTTQGGSMGWQYQVHFDDNEITSYLRKRDEDLPVEQIIALEMPDSVGGTVGSQPNFEFDTAAESRAYTEYVRVLTDVFNGQWGAMDDTMPRLESMASLETTFQSPFLSELEREESAPSRGRESEQYAGSGPLPKVGGQPGFRMEFGPDEDVDKEAESGDDDSFETGYSYLRNPDAQPNADRPWEYVGALSDDILFAYPETGARLKDMGRTSPLSTERHETGDDDMSYLETGDPRPSGMVGGD